MHTEDAALKKSQAYLKNDSFNTIAGFASIIGYIWLWWNIWPVTGGKSPIEAWVGSAVLLGVGLSGYTLKRRSFTLAVLMLNTGIFIATICAHFAFSSPVTPYLFILPIIFSSVLVQQRFVFLIAIIVSVLVLTNKLTQWHLNQLHEQDVMAVGIIALVTIASWLAARNLHTTLAWFNRAYESARTNEHIARERQAELQRLLKALNEATYSLERANYTLTLERNKAESARRIKQQFAQTISHELRTPLNIIAGFIDMMAGSPEYYGQPLPPAYMRDLSIIHKNAHHLQTLVNDVLDLARVEAVQMSLMREETDLYLLMEEAVNTARSLVEAQGLKLIVDLESDLPSLWIDPTRIRQVVFNLLSNAARFTEKGSVTVRATQDGNCIRFEVIDTGIGIPAEEIPRVFREFEQLDNSMRRRHEGAGLGLAICQRFVELHGGRIGAESVVGKGSTFWFNLPIGESTSAKPDRRLKATSKSAVQRGEEQILLVVTRSPLATALLTRYEHSYQTIFAQDAADAKSIAHRTLPQCIVIDSAHEDFQSIDLRVMAQHWGLKHVPFIACPLPGEFLLKQKLEVSGYLIKPISAHDLWDGMSEFKNSMHRILIVDDNRDFTRLLSRMLENPDHTYQIFTAHTGKEALAIMQVRPPDLILIDLGLPDIPGIQVIEQIRLVEEWRQIPIIVVSAQNEIDEAELAQPITIVHNEPFTPNEVLHYIHQILNTTALV